MTIARNRQVCLDSTPYYHCICRCVRRAFLCGEDKLTGQSYEHRRGWIEDELFRLADIFSLQLVGYAVMHNHYHVIVRIDRDEATKWSVDEVTERWGKLYAVPEIVQQYLAGELEAANHLDTIVEQWRNRLCSLSWFMKVMNYNIAVQANKEDDCTGRFWEGRFKSQALLDEAALLQCMAYVDLNPVRAKIARTPEQSEFTSIKKRLDEAMHELMPFKEPGQQNHKEHVDVIPYSFSDYLALVDWTGRIIREDKRGAIPEDYPPILDRIGKPPKEWMKLMKPRPSWTQKALGSREKIKAYCQSIGQKWLWQSSTAAES